MTLFRQSTKHQLPAYQYAYGDKTVSGVCLQNTTDYSPFGVTLDGRTIENDFYRRGFNGMEKDDELKGSGNSYDFGARMYDARSGRWLTVDPAAQQLPQHSPNSFCFNSPLILSDPDGEKPKVEVVKNEDGSTTITVTNYIFAYRKGKQNQLRSLNQSVLDSHLKGGTSNYNGETINIIIKTEVQYVDNIRQAKKEIDANEGYGVIMELGNKGGHHTSNGKYDFIKLGKDKSSAQGAHEVGHDIGFGDHYIFAGENFAFPEISRADGLMGGNNPLNQSELDIIAKDVMIGSLNTPQVFNYNEVKRPVIKKNDTWKKRDVIEVYTQVEGKDDGSMSVDPSSVGNVKKVKVIRTKGSPKGKVVE